VFTYDVDGFFGHNCVGSVETTATVVLPDGSFRIVMVTNQGREVEVQGAFISPTQITGEIDLGDPICTGSVGGAFSVAWASFESAVICTPECGLYGNGACNDGGPGSISADCPYGSDCLDCGFREPSGAPVCGNGVIEGSEACDPPFSGTCGPDCQRLGCTNSCSTSFDVWCDDGGPNSHFGNCEFGTDCADCGPRTIVPPWNNASCGTGCAFCYIGTELQNYCDPSWNGDGFCDCGCQFPDVDCQK
jgi:hypothetical protein